MSSVDPWRVAVSVAQIPDDGLHRAFEADAAERAAMASLADVRDIKSASASFDLKRRSGGRVHVTGNVHARIGQTCVVTLDAIENEIDEAVDLMFAPPEQIPTLAASTEERAQSKDEETPDLPEPIVNGMIDLGRLATDVLFLAIDPYPRRSDTVFEPPVDIVDPADHPFAALKALQTDKPPAPANKAPRKPGGQGG